MISKHNPAPAISGLMIVLMSSYIAAQMIADFSSLKIANIFGLSVDMGTFIYPITFTLRDLVHKRAGKKATRYLIVTAAGINLLMALYLFFVSAVPADSLWGLDREWNAIININLWRIVIASIIAELISEWVDTEIYQLVIDKLTKRFQFLRVLLSNSISVPLDSLLFSTIAFAFTVPWTVVLEIFIFNSLIKMAVTVLSVPMIYLVKERKKD